MKNNICSSKYCIVNKLLQRKCYAIAIVIYNIHFYPNKEAINVVVRHDPPFFHPQREENNLFYSNILEDRKGLQNHPAGNHKTC